MQIELKKEENKFVVVADETATAKTNTHWHEYIQTHTHTHKFQPLRSQEGREIRKREERKRLLRWFVLFPNSPFTRHHLKWRVHY